VRHFLFSALFAAIVFPAAAQSQLPSEPLSTCAPQVPYGQPELKQGSTSLICRKAYLLQHDNIAKIPVWVSYVLTPAHALGCLKRTNSFEPDYSLTSDKRSTVKDYAKSGYDMGHQANDGDMSWDPRVEKESFILSNMAPQLPGFNRGVWKRLEDQTRAWSVGLNSDLLIYVGPVYNRTVDPVIGGNRITVPSGFYKIIVNTNSKEVLVFKFSHKASTENLKSFISTLATVQEDTGVVFPIPEGAQFSEKLWTVSSKTVRNAKKENCNRG
jgi:endonuclease G